MSLNLLRRSSSALLLCPNCGGAAIAKPILNRNLTRRLKNANSTLLSATYATYTTHASYAKVKAEVLDVKSSGQGEIFESLCYESFFVRHSGDSDDKLHLMRVSCFSDASISRRRSEQLPSIFMVHGAIENGIIFYNKKGRGLASFLAKKGYVVYVADLKGKGQSSPSIAEQGRLRQALHGQNTYITETIPVLSDAIEMIDGMSETNLSNYSCNNSNNYNNSHSSNSSNNNGVNVYNINNSDNNSSSNGSKKYSQVWISHSWGGVMMTSSFVRFHQQLLDRIVCQVHFGTKRCINQIWSREYMFRVAFGWNFLCPLMGRILGYAPTKGNKVGIEDETLAFVLECGQWARRGAKWIDPVDGFDYAGSLSRLPPPLNSSLNTISSSPLATAGNTTNTARVIRLPPAWHIAALNDLALGNALDVKDWAEETKQVQKYTILSKANGNLDDYDHNSMLTSKSCEGDHFPLIDEWISTHNKIVRLNKT